MRAMPWPTRPTARRPARSATLPCTWRPRPTAAWSSRWMTMGRALPTPSCRACSSRSSPPSRPARARASGCRSATASSSAWAAGSPPRTDPKAAPASVFPSLPPDQAPIAIMSFIQTLTAMSRPADGDASQMMERASALFANARSWTRATRRRCESRLIALAGVVIVLVVAGLTAFVVRQIDQTAQKSSEQHVEQLVQAVTYQLGTMMAGVQQTLRYADDEIREYDTPQKLSDLTSGGRVSTHLLRDLLFINPQGRVVVSGMRPNELAGMSDR